MQLPLLSPHGQAAHASEGNLVDTSAGGTSPATADVQCQVSRVRPVATWGQHPPAGLGNTLAAWQERVVDLGHAVRAGGHHLVRVTRPGPSWQARAALW